MAKFPYTTSGTTSINVDQTTTLAWNVKTAGGTVIHSDTIVFPQGTPTIQIFDTLLQTANNYIRQDLALADLPPTFSFSIGPTDLL